MAVFYWLAVWLMMAAAFTTAWGFIVKGCEAMDGEEAAEEAGH